MDITIQNGKKICSSKVFNKNFYIPERNHYLNSLLYHALFIKKKYNPVILKYLIHLIYQNENYKNGNF